MGFLYFGGGTRVTRKIKEPWAPFSMGVHCVAHRISLVIQSFSNFNSNCLD